MSTVALLSERAITGGDSPDFKAFVRTNLGNTWNYRWAIETFIASNLSRRYRRSAIGFLWGLVSPVMTMAIMSVVFSLIFRANIHNFAVYVFSGLLPWTYMLESAVQGSQCFVAYEAYLKKLCLPKVFFPLVSVGTDTVNFLLSLTSLLFFGLLLGMKLQLSILLLPVAFAILATFNLGLVLLYSVATVYFRDLTHILQVSYTGLFYLTPLVYPISLIPEQHRALFMLNPFYWFVNLFHQILWSGVCPSPAEWYVPAALALVVLFAGLSLLHSHERDLIYRL